jgi:putative membrane protein
MAHSLLAAALHWALLALGLWLASLLFHGVSFKDRWSLWASALTLALVNAAVRPVLVWLTLPLTAATYGVFLFVINAAMVLLVAAIIPGFRVNGFWNALFTSVVIALLSIALKWASFHAASQVAPPPPPGAAGKLYEI